MLIQSLLFPSEETCTVKELYFREEEKTLVFDTYFNILSIAKWKEYTTIRQFSLVLKVKGSFAVGFYDEKGLLESSKYGSDEVKEYHIPVPCRENSQCVWFSFTPEGDAEIISGGYETPEEPVHDVRIACDICTFRREPYVRHNLELLKKNLLTNEESPVYGHLEIFVVDNGRTLKKEEVETDHIYLYPNMNAGGSGGFTRGLIEINKRKDELGLTHMIFMDDDAKMETDALVRTYALLSYISPKWEKACVSGAMLREDIPYASHEAGSHWTGLDPWTRYFGLDLRPRENVLMNETMDYPDYAAWWYACYPLSVATMDNLPLPLFIHNDDTEYGLRNQNGFILMNGICVWSPGFENKRASSLSYYDVRNCMIVNALYKEDGNLDAMKMYCRKRILANTLRYRYDDALLVVKAVEDFLKGPEYLCTLDPQEKNTEVMNAGYKLKPAEDLTGDLDALCKIYSYKDPDQVDAIYNNMKKKNKWFYALTANGWLFPAKSDKVYPFPMGIWPFDLYRKKEIILFDPDTHKGIYGKKSYAMLFRSLQAYLQICSMLKKDYARVQKEYRDAFGYLTGYKCWKGYLKLDE